MHSTAILNFVTGVLLTLVVVAVAMLYTAPDAFIDVACKASSNSSDAAACQLQSAK